MSLNDLTQKILNDARMEAEEIEKIASLQADDIVSKANSELEKEREKLRKEAERLANEKYQNIVTLSRIEARNKVLERKQELINEVFTKVRKKMEDMDAAAFKSFTVSLLSKFPPEGRSILIVGKKHTSLINKEFVQKLNQQIQKKGSGSFVLSEREPDFEDGFRLVMGDVQVDLSFDSILKTVREDVEMDIINTLFGKG